MLLPFAYLPFAMRRAANANTGRTLDTSSHSHSFNMPKSSARVRATLQLAEQLVVTQGSIFVRDLLRGAKARDKSVRIGVTKEEILENLRSAVLAGLITREHIDRWIDEVEGWGRQHVYLYRCTRAARSEPALSSPRALHNRIGRVGLEGVWEAETRPAFPEELSLGQISYDGNCLELRWHQRYEQWRREPEHDHEPETIDGDLYEFRAYRQLLRRSLLRFVLYPELRKAGLFVQIPLADPRHNAARDTVDKTANQLFKWNEYRREVSISKAIKALDELDLNAAQLGQGRGKMQSENTRFAAGGATIEFNADPAIVAWKRIDEVRRVRRALKTDAFTGHSARFIVDLQSGTGLTRTVKMSMDGHERRTYFWAQMTATEVWLILDQILAHA